ncbi:MAG: hypothetical protein CMH98_11150 [Oceanospirillaceae bacterium]|nr:hypothetical protein [Oceanospirillaceae bacterium]
MMTDGQKISIVFSCAVAGVAAGLLIDDWKSVAVITLLVIAVGSMVSGVARPASLDTKAQINRFVFIGALSLTTSCVACYYARMIENPAPAGLAILFLVIGGSLVMTAMRRA